MSRNLVKSQASIARQKANAKKPNKSPWRNGPHCLTDKAKKSWEKMHRDEA